MSWRLTGDEEEIVSGADVSAWAWELESEDGSERQTVRHAEAVRKPTQLRASESDFQAAIAERRNRRQTGFPAPGLRPGIEAFEDVLQLPPGEFDDGIRAAAEEIDGDGQFGFRHGNTSVLGRLRGACDATVRRL